MSAVSLFPSLLAFALVIALIPAALWVVKRTQALRPSRDGALQLVAGLALGPRERVAVINVGGRSLVVGVTAQSITHLATLDTQIPAPRDGSVRETGHALGSSDARACADHPDATTWPGSTGGWSAGTPWPRTPG